VPEADIRAVWFNARFRGNSGHEPNFLQDQPKGPVMNAQMPQKTQEWLEAKALEIARREKGCRELEAVRIERIVSEGRGANWKVAAFEPPLPPAAEIFAMEAIAILKGTYALTPAETNDQEALKNEYKRLSRSEPAFGTLSFANRLPGMVKSRSPKRWLKRNGSVTTSISSWPGLPIGLDHAEHELESAWGHFRPIPRCRAMSVVPPLASTQRTWGDV
jgi:hypothetical protein